MAEIVITGDEGVPQPSLCSTTGNAGRGVRPCPGVPGCCPRDLLTPGALTAEPCLCERPPVHCGAQTSPAVAVGSLSEVAPPRPRDPSPACATPGSSSAAGPGAALSTAQRRQPRLHSLDLLAQPSRSRDVGSKRLDLLLLGALPRAGPPVQRLKATRRATLPHHLPALCLELLFQPHPPRASRVPESAISVQRRSRESMPLHIWPPSDKRTITRVRDRDASPNIRRLPCPSEVHWNRNSSTVCCLACSRSTWRTTLFLITHNSQPA